MASFGTTTYTIALAFSLLLVYCYQKLRWYRFQQYDGFPQPPTDLFLGNIKTVARIITKGDPKRHSDYIFQEISRSLGDPPVFKLDMRPMGPILCIINSQEVAEKMSKVSKMFPYSVPKSPTMRVFLPIIGNHSILLAEGEEWKSLRKLFNPGFAPQYLTTLLPRICEKTSIFIERLDEHATAGDTFDLDELCVNLTFDIIGTVVLDIDMNAQLRDKTKRDSIVAYYSNLAQAYTTRGDVYFVSPITFFKRIYYGRLADRAVQNTIKKRFLEAQREGLESQRRSVVSLALASIEGRTLSNKLLQQITDQVKTFLFAGHDTTSILLQWSLYELSRYPFALSTLRSELDAVLGPDPHPQTIMQQLTSQSDEDFMHQLKYTSAIIKETLRLYPPASSARTAPSGSNLTITLSSNGPPILIDGLSMYNSHYLIQRSRTTYGATAETWLPERWLDASDPIRLASPSATLLHDQHTATHPPGSWRPFERGPRNCIGQELANIEARVILACIARRYDFVKVGLGEIVRDEKGLPVLGQDGKAVVEKNQQLYNKRQVTAKPIDGTRSRVSFH